MLSTRTWTLTWLRFSCTPWIVNRLGNVRATTAVLVWCSLLLYSPPHGLSQTDRYWQTVVLYGQLNLPFDSATMTVVALDRDGRCRPPGLPDGAICAASVRYGAVTARFDIAARGYKRYWRNLPTLTFTNDTARIDLGRIVLEKSKLPIFQQVVRGKTAHGRTRFEITLYNPLKRDFLITKVTVSLHRAGNGKLCCCAPMAIFEFREALTLTAIAGDSVSVQGTVVEKQRGEGITVNVEGQIRQSGCDGSEDVRLTLPASFILPRTDYAAIHVELPERFTITSTKYVYDIWNRPGVERGDPPPKVSLLGDRSIDRYGSVWFWLTTADDDELDIVGHYPP